MKYLLLLFILISKFSFATNVPNYTGYVNDYAHLLTDAQRNDLEQRLRRNENAGGWQIAVVTVPDLQGESIEEFANDLFQKWGIGRKATDDGVLLIESMNPRKVRIEVGRGNEGDLTDLLSGRIIRNIIVPHLKAGDNYTGLSEGVNAIIAARPKPLTQAEIDQQTKDAATAKQEEKIKAIHDGWQREQDRKAKQLEDERSWNSFKDISYTIFLWFILTLPITGWLGYRLFQNLRKKHILKLEKEKKQRAIDEAKCKEDERLEAIEEAKRRKKEAEQRAIQLERQRAAEEKDRQWRKDHPAEAREKDRLAAIAAAEALEEYRKRRKREEEEEEEQSARRRREEANSFSSSSSSWGGSSGGSDSGSSFGGFGGGSSDGGGASGGF